MTANRVFVSYSHKDKRYFEQMMVHLRPLMHDGIEVWSDTDIQSGEKWQEKIATALNESDAAILLISADFLASEFITKNELPPLLGKAEQDGTRILPVILKPCGFSRSTLSQFQAVNGADRPLTNLGSARRDAIWQKLASDLLEDQKPSTATPSKRSPRTTEREEDAPRGVSQTDEAIWNFFRKELADPALLKDYHIYKRDTSLNLGIWLNAGVVFKSHTWGSSLLWEAGKILKRCGWLGTGSLRLLWLPPSCIAEPANNEARVKYAGVWIWYVSNKSSDYWLASPYSLAGFAGEEVVIPEDDGSDIPF